MDGSCEFLLAKIWYSKAKKKQGQTIQTSEVIEKIREQTNISKETVEHKKTNRKTTRHKNREKGCIIAQRDFFYLRNKIYI